MSIDAAIARAVFERNVRNSLRVLSGDFESTLADLIEQLEDPPRIDGVPLSVEDMTRRIARAMRQGFAGLSPNGFEFCTWLWDSAPLYLVRIPVEAGATVRYQHGVIHLRRIAVMVAELYVTEQPERVDALVQLIDSSVDWVDARNLVVFGLLEHYSGHFAEEYGRLLVYARERKHWRKYLALQIAGRMIMRDASWTAMSLAVLPFAFEYAEEEAVASGLRYALRCATLYGNHDVLATFVRTLEDVTDPAVQRLVCEAVAKSRRPWGHAFRATVLPTFNAWQAYGSGPLQPVIEPVLALLRSKD